MQHSGALPLAPPYKLSPRLLLPQGRYSPLAVCLFHWTENDGIYEKPPPSYNATHKRGKLAGRKQLRNPLGVFALSQTLVLNNVRPIKIFLDGDCLCAALLGTLLVCSLAPPPSWSLPVVPSPLLSRVCLFLFVFPTRSPFSNVNGSAHPDIPLSCDAGCGHQKRGEQS